MGILEPLECKGTVAPYGRNHVSIYIVLMVRMFEDTDEEGNEFKTLTDKTFACVQTGANLQTPTKLIYHEVLWRTSPMRLSPGQTSVSCLFGLMNMQFEVLLPKGSKYWVVFMQIESFCIRNVIY